MSLKDALLLAGVSDRDLAEAVRDARSVTKLIHKLSGAAEGVLETIAVKRYLGNRTRSVVVLGMGAAQAVHHATAEMLKVKK